MNKDDFKSIIDFAIESEIESYEFYRDAAKKVKDDNLKGIFDVLAKEELEHKSFLENVLAEELVKIELDELADYKIAEGIDKPELNVDMSFKDAVGLAIKSEEEAMDRYENLAKACVDKEQKELFLGLVKMEQTHKAKLEEIYTNVAYAEVW